MEQNTDKTNITVTVDQQTFNLKIIDKLFESIHLSDFIVMSTILLIARKRNI